jgi:hypothetical protein
MEDHILQVKRRLLQGARVAQSVLPASNAGLNGFYESEDKQPMTRDPFFGKDKQVDKKNAFDSSENNNGKSMDSTKESECLDGSRRTSNSILEHPFLYPEKSAAVAHHGNVESSDENGSLAASRRTSEIQNQNELDVLRVAAIRKSMADLDSTTDRSLFPSGLMGGLQDEMTRNDLGRLRYAATASRPWPDLPTNMASLNHEVGTYGIIVGEPRPEDLLFGIDPVFQFHPGNIHLRNMIQASVGYHPSSTEQKVMISKGILARLKIAGSRYLTRESTGPRGLWYQVTDIEAEVLVFRRLCDEERHLQAAVHNASMGAAISNRTLQELVAPEEAKSGNEMADANVGGDKSEETEEKDQTSASDSADEYVPHSAQSADRIQSKRTLSRDCDKAAPMLSKGKNKRDKSTKLSRMLSSLEDTDFSTLGAIKPPKDRGASQSDSSTESEDDFVDRKQTPGPGPHDVVCGRGRGNFRHPGNRRLLRIFQEYKHRYRAATKTEKTLIAKEIVLDIQSKGGRFLKRGDDGIWSVVGDKEAFRKVCHGIRDIPKDPPGSENSLPKAPHWKVALEEEANGAVRTLDSFAENGDPPKATDKVETRVPSDLPVVSTKQESSSKIPTVGETTTQDRLVAAEASQTKLLFPSGPGISLERPGFSDVVCGRGRGHFSHPGNRRMLSIIHENRARYKIATKVGKGTIAREIMAEIKRNGGHFLKRKEGDSSIWEEVEYKEALKKVCHGIRDSLCNYEAKHTREKSKDTLMRTENGTKGTKQSPVASKNKRPLDEAENSGVEPFLRSVRQRQIEMEGISPEAAAAAATLSGSVVDSYLLGSLQGMPAAATGGIPMHLILAAQQAAAHPSLSAEEAMLLHSQGRGGQSCIIS